MSKKSDEINKEFDHDEEARQHKQRHDIEPVNEEERQRLERDKMGQFPAHEIPADKLREQQREQDHIREQQQMQAQESRNEVAGEPVPEKAMPFSASINEPQTLSTPIPEGIKVPVPKITSIDPTSCTLGDDDFTLDVTGDNFFADSVICFAGHDEPTTFNEEESTLSTGVDMSVWHGPDTVQVQVKNGPEISNAMDFTFNEAAGAARKENGDDEEEEDDDEDGKPRKTTKRSKKK